LSQIVAATRWRFCRSGDAGAELLEFGEEIFGKVSRFIEVLIKVARRQATSSRRDDGWFAGGREGLAYTVIGLEGLSAIRTSAAR
jgi:hypothetical protein